ncbi:MAG: sterol desaturase family protein [Hyphomonadaceae bacterium]
MLGVDLAGAESVLANLWAMISDPFVIGPASRLYYLNFVVFMVCGALVFWLRRDEREAHGGPLRFTFPVRMYLSQSSLVDLKIYIANHCVSFKAAGVRLLSTTFVAGTVAVLLEPVIGGWSIGGDAFWATVVCAILIAMANDLTTYVTHRITHENKALWPFHKVHHSAEVLTPLTVYRKHPIYGLLNSCVQPLVAGPVIGVTALIFDQTGSWRILGMNAIYMIFNFVGANLRHSHIWIDFGPVFSRIFVSPAMHQVHHSIDPKHYDRNYGEVFALWDWMFGTLYIPKERENLTFGISDVPGGAPVQPHATLKDAYLEPIRSFAQEVTRPRGNAEPAAQPAGAQI